MVYLFLVYKCNIKSRKHSSVFSLFTFSIEYNPYNDVIHMCIVKIINSLPYIFVSKYASVDIDI